jgi:acetyl esterase/lipase
MSLDPPYGDTRSGQTLLSATSSIGYIRGRRSCRSPGAFRAPPAHRAAGGPDTPGYAALADVADPARRPPAYIEVAQLDMFRNEDLAYALRLGQAGVPVESHLDPGAPHEFDFIAFNTTAFRRAIADGVLSSTGCPCPSPPGRGGTCPRR